mgnify:CR=1 FL=1
MPLLADVLPQALEMLMVKDKRIEELEAQVEDLQRGSERLRGQVAELQERAQAAEDQVCLGFQLPVTSSVVFAWLQRLLCDGVTVCRSNHACR